MALGAPTSSYGPAPTAAQTRARQGRGPQGANPYATPSSYSAYNASPIGVQTAQIGSQIQDAIYQQQRANALIPVIGANYDRQGANARTNADLELARIGLNEQGLGIDRGANLRDRAYYDNLLFTNQESFNNQVAQLQAAQDQSNRQANSQATASGAWLGSGRGQAITDARTQFNQQREAADISRRERALGLEKSRAETYDKEAKLDILGQNYGLDRKKVQANLEQGLADLGFDKFIKMDDLLQKASSPFAAIAGPAQDVIDKAMQAGMVMGGGAMGDYYKFMFGG